MIHHSIHRIRQQGQPDRFVMARHLHVVGGVCIFSTHETRKHQQPDNQQIQ